MARLLKMKGKGGLYVSACRAVMGLLGAQRTSDLHTPRWARELDILDKRGTMVRRVVNRVRRWVNGAKLCVQAARGGAGTGGCDRGCQRAASDCGDRFRVDWPDDQLERKELIGAFDRALALPLAPGARAADQPAK